MPSISGAEILVVLALALLLFGPRSLPKIGKTLGRAMGELRRASRDFKSSLEQEVELEEIRKAKDGVTSVGREISEAVTGSEPAARPSTTPDAAKRPTES